MKMRPMVSVAYMKTLVVPEMTLDQKTNALYAEQEDIRNGRTKLNTHEQPRRLCEISDGLKNLLGLNQ
jgi:hypothetical protein